MFTVSFRSIQNVCGVSICSALCDATIGFRVAVTVKLVLFIGALAQLRKATAGYVTSVC